jgi:hypothetical protein
MKEAFVLEVLAQSYCRGKVSAEKKKIKFCYLFLSGTLHFFPGLVILPDSGPEVFWVV